MFSLHCVDRSSAEAVRQRKENLGREFPGHSPDPLRGNDNGRKAKRYDVKIRRRVDRKRENSAILFSFQIVVQFGIDDIRDEHVAQGMGGFAFSTAACGVTPQGQNTGISPS